MPFEEAAVAVSMLDAHSNSHHLVLHNFITSTLHVLSYSFFIRFGMHSIHVYLQRNGELVDVNTKSSANILHTVKSLVSQLLLLVYAVWCTIRQNGVSHWKIK